MYKVILVDDEYIIRKKIRELIDWENLGFEVVADFEDGAETINFLKNNVVDLVITDIKMTNISGIGVAEYIYKYTPETVVVFLSGYNEIEYAKFGMQYGVKKYLNKPISKATLKKEIISLKEYLDKLNDKQECFDFGLYTNFFHNIISGNDVTDSRFMKEFMANNYHFCSFDMILEKEKITNKRTRALMNIFRFCFLDTFCCIMSHDACMYKIIMFSKKEFSKTWDKEYSDTIYESLNMKVYIDNITYFGTPSQIKNIYNKDKEESSVSVRTKRFVERLKEYVDAHFTEDISLETLSKEFFVSSYYISRVFKKGVGLNISEYVMQKRVDYAKKLLLTTDLSITEIMFKVGYNAEPYFFTLFKKYTGMTPVQFKNKEC